MAWESPLDRLVLTQIHLAEKGDLRGREVEQLLRDILALDPKRPGTAFLTGYARTLLGLDLPEASADVELRRWDLFGRLRGHDRRGERNWVAEILQRSEVLMELLQDPNIAAQCLPLVMRTLFWCEDLTLAVRAIEFMASDARSETSDTLVDAAIGDLLGRLEVREDREDREPTAAILEKCIQLPCFERQPADVRARYFRALATRQLAASDFTGAQGSLRVAHTLAAGAPRLQSSVAALAALTTLRLHDIFELQPRPQREQREAALVWFAESVDSVPEEVFVLGVLSYETGDYATARGHFDRCLEGLRRTTGRDLPLLHRTRFFLAASILAAGDKGDSPRALKLMDEALAYATPDLESFYPVHEALKELDRRIALRFLDAVDIGRGTAPDQLLFVALEYVSLAEAERAATAADRVLQVAVNLDQRVDAMRVLLTARNMQGDRDGARDVFFAVRDLLMHRGAFAELEHLLQNEEQVGQALDHVEIKCELVALYEEMEGKDLDRAMLQTSIARSLRARKDAEALQQAFALLKEVEISFPELATDELKSLEKLLAHAEAEPADPNSGASLVVQLTQQLGRRPVVLVVGGNERQRRHHPRFEALAVEWGFDGEWLMANYTSPQRVVAAIHERLKGGGLDTLVLLHWNRHETTEPALELARKHNVPARTVHYAGFTSLQVVLADMLKNALKTAGEGKKNKAAAR